MKCLVALFAMLVVSVPLLQSHPHFRKTITTKMTGLEVKLEYTTYPWNAAHLAEVKDGFVFHCGNAAVELTTPAKQGTNEVPAGRYLLRARATDVDHWTFLLVPAPPDRNTPPDMTKAFALPTTTLKGTSVHDHLELDLVPGHGDTEGKVIFVLSWGDRQLEGLLAEFPATPR